MEPYARYLPSRTFTYMAGSAGLALLLVVGASFLSKEPAEGGLMAVGNTSAASQELTALIRERIAAQQGAAPSEDWQKEFDSITSKPLNPATDLSSTTLTDLLARSLFTQFASSQNEGVVDAATQQKIIDGSLGKITLRFSTYSAADLSILEDGSAAAIRRYGNELGQVVRDNSSTNVNEAVILYQALNQDNRDALRALDPISTSYRNLLSYSLQVKVPREAVGVHLDFVNSLSAMAETIAAMQVAFQDPVRTILYLNKYQASAQALLDSVTKLKKLFESRGVSFSANESGSTLVDIASQF